MPKRILIAEDEQETRELLSKFAIMHGYDVKAVADGVDLLYIIANESFDLIITDLMMPNLNGASAAEIIKLHGNTTPIVALTALSHYDIQLVHDKFSKVFNKPINVSKLFKYVDSMIGRTAN